MYQIGDLIFYGNTGVCKITDISPQKIPGSAKGQLYYTVLPLRQKCVIYSPVEGGRVFMRPIISREEAEQLIDKIPSIQAKACYSPALRQLKEHYEAALNSHDCAELVELTMSIYTKKQELEAQKRKFGSVDEQFMRRAEELLFGELAAALGISESEVPGYIEDRVSRGSGEGGTVQ
ncbi:CarD family transcriptional regulator [Bacilliculturomica massiliensis]|uniref:CarD family transcriptional regulator n=1 Tax=Bacilliculturomica massiliensis TaxID=1917867 RepID=UPI00103235A0|nr:CarD family transcriptional regulator [Bacilliculturomica massiliensis]